MAFPASKHSTDVRYLADLLKATPIDGMISYDAMTKALGFNIINKRYLIPAAMRLASTEVGAIFENIRGQGYHRLRSAEVHQIGLSARRRVRSTTRRASNTIDSTISKANDMTDADLRKALREMSALDLIRFMATDRVIKAAMPESEKPQPVAKSLASVLDYLNGNKTNEVA